MDRLQLTDRMPNPDEHHRVLIYTGGSDFNGEQVSWATGERLFGARAAPAPHEPEKPRSP